MASRDGLISPPAKYMKYSFAVRAQSQLGLPLAEQGRDNRLVEMRFSQNPHFVISREYGIFPKSTSVC